MEDSGARRRKMGTCKGLLVTPNALVSVLSFAILAAPSVYFLSRFPPLWRDSDGFYQVSTRPNYLQLLHWPPLYCLWARIPILVGNWIGAHGAQPLLVTNSFDEPGLAEPGLFALVLVQQTLLVVGLLTACLTICTRPIGRIGLVLLFVSQAWLYAFAQCVGSEAFAHLFALLVIACAVVWRRENGSRRLTNVLLFLALTFAALARHINLLLLLLVPLWCCFDLIASLRYRGTDRRSASLRSLRRLLRATLIGFFALAASTLVTWACCSFYHVPYRSRLGYVFQWRLNYLAGLSPAERTTRFAQLTKDLRDPAIDYGIKAWQESIGKGGGWQTELLSQAIFEWFQKNTTLPFRQQACEMDIRLNRICRWFLLSGDQKLYGSILQDTIHSLQFSPAEIAREPFVCTDALIGMSKKDDRLAAVRGLPSLQRPMGLYEEEWRTSWYCNLWKGWPIAGFAVAAFGLCLLGHFVSRWKSETWFAVISFIGCGVLLILANSAVTFVSPRFDGPTCLLFLAALAYSLDTLLESRASPASVAVRV
jgi:hypothetical protein